MKNFLLKAILTLDLWIVLVTSIVFTSLYFIDQSLYLNQLLIVISSIVVVNLLFMILFMLKHIKQNRVLNKYHNK